jgi:pilus assembly protein Flp/PilA
LETVIAEEPALRKLDRRYTMKKHVMAFLRDEEGLTIVEYAVAAGLISALVVLAFTNLGTTVLGIINFLIQQLGGGGAP